MTGFVARNKPDWDELESLVAKARKSVRRMSLEELRRLDVLYRRTTVHLSQVSTRTTDTRLTAYLNELAAAAHAIIYLPPRSSAWKGAGLFFSEGFARLIARTWKFHAVSAALLLGGAIFGFFASLSDPVAAYALSSPTMSGDPRVPGATREELLKVLRGGREDGYGTKSSFAALLFNNNFKVGIRAITLGVLAGIPTILIVTLNGMMLGGFAAIHYRAGLDTEMWAWILPHGITELGAVILCGGIGLTLGAAVIAPGALTRSESLKRAGLDAVLMSLGAGLMLVFAAVIESFLRQSHLGTEARLAFAAATGVFWVAFIAHGFLRERKARLAISV